MSEGGGLRAPPNDATMEVDSRQASAAVVPPATGPADLQLAEQAVEQRLPQMRLGGAVDRIEEGESEPLSAGIGGEEE